MAADDHETQALSIEEMSNHFLNRIESMIRNAGTSLVPLYGRIMDRGQIGTLMGDETGTYQVTVKRVSPATPVGDVSGG